MGQLDDLAYRIMKSPRAKTKVAHHDQLKRYRSREPLDNTWVIDRAQEWTPSEILPPDVDDDPAGQDLGLHNLFVFPYRDDPIGPQSSISSADVSFRSLPPTSSHVILDHGGGVVGEPHRQAQHVSRPGRQRRGPDRYEDWVTKF